MAVEYHSCVHIARAFLCGTVFFKWSLAFLFAAGLGLAGPAHAADFTWNGNGTSFGTATNWTPGGGPPGTGDNGIFNDAGAANTSVQASGASLDGLIFNGATSYEIEVSGGLNLSDGIFNNSGADQTVYGFGFGTRLTGTGGIVQNGAGTLTLGVREADYTGDTTLTSGTLRALSFSPNSPFGTGTLIINGGTLGNAGPLPGLPGASFLTFDNDVQVNSDFGVELLGGSQFVQVNGQVDLGSTSRTVMVTRETGGIGGNSLIFGNAIVGGPGTGITFVTNDNGAEIIYSEFDSFTSFANTYTGLTTVGEGVDLRLQKTNDVTAIAGDLTINAGGEVSLLNNNQIANGVTVIVNGQLDAEFSTAETIGNLQGGGRIRGGGGLFGSLFTFTVHQGAFSGDIDDGPSPTAEVALVKDTAGMLILSGDNSYSGTTTINAGTLQIGAGGTTGTLGTGNVVNNGVLTFNRSNTFAVDNLITGGGVVNKQGSGTLELTNGGNDYTGGTTINGGTLRIGASGATGSGTLTVLGSTISYADAVDETNPIDLQANVDLEVRDSESATQSGVIGETGVGFGVTKTGAGTLILTGTNTYSGGTTIQAGRLIVNGGIGAVTLLQGGVLGGSGTVGAIDAFGTIAPGNSFGTLNASGDVRFNAGSTFQVEVDALGNSDRLATTGQAIISAAGTTLDIVALAGTFPDTVTYTVLTADGGVTGQFAAVTDNLPDIDFKAIYNTDNVQLFYHRAASDLSPKDIHPAATAATLDTGLDFSATLRRRGGVSAGGITSAGPLGDLSLGYAPSTATGPSYIAIVDDGTSAAPPSSQWVGWGSALGGRVDVDGSGAVPGWTSKYGGFVAGGERGFEGSRMKGIIGLAAGFVSGDVNSGGSDADTTSWHAGVYGATVSGPLTVAAAITAAFQEYDYLRSVGVATAAGETTGYALAASAEAFLDIARLPGFGPVEGWRFGPLATIDAGRVRQDGFTETGAGILNLTVSDSDASQTVTGLGIAFGADRTFDARRLAVDARVTWEHVFGDTSVSTESEIPVALARFQATSAAQARDRVAIGLGAALEVSDSVTTHIRYDSRFSSSNDDHSVTGGLTVRF